MNLNDAMFNMSVSGLHINDLISPDIICKDLHVGHNSGSEIFEALREAGRVQRVMDDGRMKFKYVSGPDYIDPATLREQRDDLLEALQFMICGNKKHTNGHTWRVRNAPSTSQLNKAIAVLEKVTGEDYK